MTNPLSEPIGEGSSLKLGLAVIFATWIALSSWWAATISSKLSVVVSGQQQSNGDLTAIRARVEMLERISDQFTQFGSPALRVRIDALEKSSASVQLMGSPKVIELEKRVTVLERSAERK